MPDAGPSTYETVLDSENKFETQLVIQELEHGRQGARKGLRFWMIFVAISISMFMSALEFVRSLD